MKILWLYKYFANFNTDHWLHMDFARYINKINGLKLRAYGPGLELDYSDIVPVRYHEDITMEQLYKKFKFDVVILNTKSRMFHNYFPCLHPYNFDKIEINTGMWLPKDFDSFNCPKIMIDEDYHYELNDDWYYDRGIKLIIQRHRPHSLVGGKVKKVWHPFSVDINTFKPNPRIIRKNTVHFIGSISEPYIYRKMAAGILKSHGYLPDYCPRTKTIDSNYIKALQAYTAYLSGASIYNIAPAKMFEVMASEGILITNAPLDADAVNYGLFELFPADSLITFDHVCGSDLIEKVDRIIKDEGFRNYTVKNALKAITGNHTHEIRINQIINTIKKEFNI